MFGQFIRPCRNLIFATPESWWRSLVLFSYPFGPVFSNHVCGTLFCPSWTTRANDCHCSFNTQNFWVITARFAAVILSPVPPTLGVVTNTEGFGKSWNLSCISEHSSLLISAKMYNISKWSAKNCVSHHSKWPTSPRRGQHNTPFWGGGARGKVLLRLWGSCRSTSFDASSSSGWGYSADSLTSIGRNVSLTNRKIGESTQVWSGHSLYHCPETSFRSSVSPNTNEKHASFHPCTLYTPEATREVNLSTRVFSLASSSSFPSRSTRCAFSFGMQTIGFPFATFHSDNLLTVQGFAIWIIWCGACCWASWFSGRMACIRLFTAVDSTLAPCFSITLSFSGSPGAPENSHIVW